MTVDDGLNMTRVGQALISPDGEWVLFSKSELDWKENKRKSTYYKVPAAGGEAYQYVGEAAGEAFRFSPAGTYLSFLRETPAKKGKKDSKKSEDGKKEKQIFFMRTAGGEAVQLSKHPKGIVAYEWARDESRVFFLADESRSKRDEKLHEDGYDAIFVDEGANGQGEGSWRHLWTLELESRKETRLTDGSLRIGSFDVSPDGQRVVFTARTENRRNQRYLSELYVLDVGEKETTRLTDNRAPESDVRWAPDGRSFAYKAPDDREWELANEKLWIMDAGSREYRVVSDRFDGNIGDYFWAPDGGSLRFTGLQRTNANLFEVDVATKQVRQLTALEGVMSVSSFSADHSRYVYSFEDFDTPADLYVASLDDGEPVRLTDLDPWVEEELLLAAGRVIRWKSSDGLEIEGLLHLPADHQEGVRLPLMLHIHGGPAGVFRNRFDPDYHVYAGLGYVSLSPNVRGSSGYDDDLLRGNMRDIGGGDYQDLMTGVDHAIERGYADPDRLALRGWSYGGILGGWTVTQTNRFKAASVGAMVSDWTSEYGPGFNHDVRLWYIGGTPWENPEGYRQRSGLTHVANVKTPTIIFHGMKDRTDTEPQSMMFYAALKDQGREVRYLRFPREPHGFREPRHQRTRDIEEIRWMQQHVLGAEWTPWERKDEAEEEGGEPQDAEAP